MGDKVEWCDPPPTLVRKACYRCGRVGHRVADYRAPTAAVRKDWKIVRVQEVQCSGLAVQGAKNQLGQIEQEVSEPCQKKEVDWQMVEARKVAHKDLSSHSGELASSQRFVMLADEGDTTEECIEDQQLCVMLWSIPASNAKGCLDCCQKQLRGQFSEDNRERLYSACEELKELLDKEDGVLWQLAKEE
ncbi:hypothetical protein Dimus_032979 [Dionaea muscipula]